MRSNDEQAERRELIQFNWEVPTAGFRWVDGYDKKDPCRVLVADGSIGVRNLFFVPLEPESDAYADTPPGKSLHRSNLPPTLFRTFASTSPSEEGVVEFANQFGCLGPTCSRTIHRPNAPLDDPRALSGEPLDEWARQIWLMSQAIALWDAYKTREERQIKRLLEFHSQTVEGISQTFVNVKGQGIPLEWEWQTTISANLSKRPGAVARRILDRIITPELTDMEVQSRDLRMVVVLKSLRSFLWYQLLLAIGRDARHETCEVCGTWFEPRSRRKVAKYCSNKCQMRAYRKRQEDALELHAKGVPASQIAKQVGSTVTSVRAWIKVAPQRSSKNPRPKGKRTQQPRG